MRGKGPIVLLAISLTALLGLITFARYISPINEEYLDSGTANYDNAKESFDIVASVPADKDVQYQTSSIDSKELEAYEAPTIHEMTQKVSTLDKSNVITSDELLNASSKQISKYYYSTLDENSKKVYLEIYCALMNYENDVVISTLDTEILDYVLLCVLYDHPEIYWVDGYECTKCTNGGKLVQLKFGGHYIMTPEEAAQYDTYVQNYVNNCLSGISMSATDYEKSKYVYDYLASHTSYVRGATFNQNILSVFLYGESVCQGYAKAAQYLFDKLGIQSFMVAGVTGGNLPHAWLVVKLDGEYYHFDPTWGDVEVPENNINSVNYYYLNASTAQIGATHVIDNSLPVPLCTAIADNYYIVSDLYFDSVDMARIKATIKNEYAKHNGSIELLCANSDVYYGIYNELITNSKIFDILTTADSVQYLETPELRMITFYVE